MSNIIIKSKDINNRKQFDPEAGKNVFTQDLPTGGQNTILKNDKLSLGGEDGKAKLRYIKIIVNGEPFYTDVSPDYDDRKLPANAQFVSRTEALREMYISCFGREAYDRQVQVYRDRRRMEKIQELENIRRDPLTEKILLK